MATSTFDSHFSVKKNSATDFVKEMSKTVPPTLRSNFDSNFTHLAQNNDLKERLLVALRK